MYANPSAVALGPAARAPASSSSSSSSSLDEQAEQGQTTETDPSNVGARALEMVLGTLTGMATGGIRDWVGGGFHRYSTDPEWLVPHFEKMLYDQAQLLGTYVDAFKITRDEAFAAVAHATARCVRARAMIEIGAVGGLRQSIVRHSCRLARQPMGP